MGTAPAQCVSAVPLPEQHVLSSPDSDVQVGHLSLSLLQGFLFWLFGLDLVLWLVLVFPPFSVLFLTHTQLFPLPR